MHVKRVWLPRGIVIPWIIDGQLWRLTIRRLHDPHGLSARYVTVTGSANARSIVLSGSLLKTLRRLNHRR